MPQPVTLMRKGQAPGQTGGEMSQHCLPALGILSHLENAKKKKKKGNQEKHEHCATKEQIPSFKIAFQKSDECCGAPELGILLNNCQGTLSVRK